MAQRIPDEIRNQIINDAELLTGTLHKRSEILAKKHGYSRIWISGLIRHLIPYVSRNVTDEDRSEIKRLFEGLTGKPAYRYREISKQTGFCDVTVRYAISPRKEITYFNPREAQF